MHSPTETWTESCITTSNANLNPKIKNKLNAPNPNVKLRSLKPKLSSSNFYLSNLTFYLINRKNTLWT